MSFTFGGTPAAAPAASSSGFNFGNMAAAPAATGGSGFNFGSTPAPAAGSGGSSFSFGTTPAAAPAAGGASSFGGGFGSTPAAPAATGGSSFSFGSTPSTGGAAAPATGGGFGGGFGSTTTGGSSLFGATSQTAKPPLFGQKTGTTTGSGFGFGNTTGTTTGSSFGGFGTTTSAAQPAAGSSGFGFGTTATTGSTGFGTTSSFGGGFGSTAATPSAFGTAGGSTFGTAPAPVNTPAPIICGADAAVAQLNSVKYAYQDPAQSRFKFLLYNAVDPTQRHLYTRPAYISERQWNQAELDNPDPLHFAPAPVIGFKDLLKRIQVQQEYADKYNNYTNDLRGQLKEMEKATRATEEKLEKCRHEHVQLFHTLVKSYGKPLQRNEMQLAMMLKKLQTLLDSPAQYKARLNDAVALQRIQDAAPAPPANQLSPEDLQRVYQFLDKQRQGLEHLTSILNDDLADIKLIKETWRR